MNSIIIWFGQISPEGSVMALVCVICEALTVGVAVEHIKKQDSLAVAIGIILTLLPLAAITTAVAILHPRLSSPAIALIFGSGMVELLFLLGFTLCEYRRRKRCLSEAACAK